MNVKYCSDCGEDRPISEFGKRADRKDGLKPYCKKHTNIRQKNYYHENPEFSSRRIAAASKWAKDNPEKHLEQTKRHAKLNRVYYRNNCKKWYNNNKERVLANQSSYRKHRYATDPSYRLRVLLRTRVAEMIRRKKSGIKAGSAIKDLGCTTVELVAFIEAKFKPGMTWKNHGTLWELDHIKRLADFDLTDRAQFLEACHFTNLQPLWLEEHIKKTTWEVQNTA